MRSRGFSLAVIAAAVGVAGGVGDVAHAFSPRARAEITRRALTLMPDGLQRQLRKHARPLFTGSLAGLAASGEDRQALDPGSADEELEAAIERTAALIAARRPMSEVAESFGRIAQIAGDLSFPLNIGPSDEREATIRDDFARYIDRKLPRMSITFSGYPDRQLAGGDVRGFAEATGGSARRDYGAVLRSYFPEGRERLPQDFDERSVAFAAASLGVSRAVTTTAKAWLYAWHRAHGDMAGAALLRPDAYARPFDPPDAGQARAQDSHESRSTP